MLMGQVRKLKRLWPFALGTLLFCLVVFLRKSLVDNEVKATEWMTVRFVEFSDFNDGAHYIMYIVLYIICCL